MITSLCPHCGFENLTESFYEKARYINIECDCCSKTYKAEKPQTEGLEKQDGGRNER